MINVGIDWANDHHDICIVNDQGKLIEKFRIDHDAA
ncbi:MAG: IS110 family transposase [PVC group bacterium]|nr:IS110 family transposase [PVC group bacterium]